MVSTTLWLALVLACERQEIWLGSACAQTESRRVRHDDTLVPFPRHSWEVWQQKTLTQHALLGNCSSVVAFDGNFPNLNLRETVQNVDLTFGKNLTKTSLQPMFQDIQRMSR